MEGKISKDSANNERRKVCKRQKSPKQPSRQMNTKADILSKFKFFPFQHKDFVKENMKAIKIQESKFKAAQELKSKSFDCNGKSIYRVRKQLSKSSRKLNHSVARTNLLGFKYGNRDKQNKPYRLRSENRKKIGRITKSEDNELIRSKYVTLLSQMNSNESPNKDPNCSDILRLSFGFVKKNEPKDWMKSNTRANTNFRKKLLSRSNISYIPKNVWGPEPAEKSKKQISHILQSNKKEIKYIMSPIKKKKTACQKLENTIKDICVWNSNPQKDEKSKSVKVTKPEETSIPFFPHLSVRRKARNPTKNKSIQNKNNNNNNNTELSLPPPLLPPQNPPPDWPSEPVVLPEVERKLALRMLRKSYLNNVSELNKLPFSSGTIEIYNKKKELEKILNKLEKCIDLCSDKNLFVNLTDKHHLFG